MPLSPPFSRLFMLSVLLTIVTAISSFAQIRSVTSINSLWEFSKDVLESREPPMPDDSVWQTINLPHTWNDKDVMADGKRGYFRGVGWYHKTLFFDITDSKKKHYLHFEGANQVTEVYINRKFAGRHVGGYSAFTIDITNLIKFGKPNLIFIKVNNSHNPDIPPLSADFTFFGGIYRDLFLITTDAVHFDMADHGTTGIYIETPEVSEKFATVLIRGKLINESNTKRKLEVRSTIKDVKGDIIAEITSKLTVQAGENQAFSQTSNQLNNISLWSPDNPTLYTVETTITEKEHVLDFVVNPLGFRWFKFDAEEGFFLNGKHIKLIGANRHQDYQGMGNALTDEQHEQDLKLLKDMGGNFIRNAHYPQDPAVLKAANRLGLVVWEEIPLVDEITNSLAHTANAHKMATEMIRQHYNHPSVIMWGYMNEIFLTAQRNKSIEKGTVDPKPTVKLAQSLEEILRKEDPNRLTVMALNASLFYNKTKLDSIPMGVGWNLYHGWYYDELEDFGKFMDDQHHKYPQRIQLISEYGAGSDVRLHSAQPERFDFTMEFQKKYHESYLKQILERPYIAGATIWNLIDFSSEGRVDAISHLNSKGVISANRVPKDTYYLYQAALLNKPILVIAETNNKIRSGYPLAEGLGFARQTVDVYTNLKTVELFQNGKSLGKKEVRDFKATWNVDFTDGLHQFVAKGTANNIEHKDLINIDFSVIPYHLTNFKPGDIIAINAGCNYNFLDTRSGLVWVHDKPYAQGSWGYIGGKHYYKSNKIGTKEDIQTVNEEDPLYQTMHIGAEQYKFDVPDGTYEIELLMVEPYPKSRRFVTNAPEGKGEGGKRIFNVLINKKTICKEWNLQKEFGYNFPWREKVIITTDKNAGIAVRFEAIKGESIISAIKIKRIY